MKIIGFNLAKTSYGLPLDNGGACLIVDGEVVMLINEERLNRKQYSPGFQKSIEYLLRSNNLTVDEIDIFVASSCLEIKQTVGQVQSELKRSGFSVPGEKIVVCDHHLSHAYSAYYPSGFDRAIVMVLDGDGNTLGPTITETGIDNYWKNENEHNSYYLANGDDIDFLCRDEVSVGENGFGGVYRYFTYFCGFLGYRFAGKLMGLSAYGSKRNKYSDIKLFELGENGSVKALLPDADRLNSPLVVENWLKSVGISVKARTPDEPINQDIEDIAFLVQRELDRALIHKVNYLVQSTGVKNLCVAGGVGLNAVSNRAILDNTEIENVFIQPAAGDSGQCLGNAYFGVQMFDMNNLKRKPISVYQGTEYTEAEIETTLHKYTDKVVFEKLDNDSLFRNAATEIYKGGIIGWYQGRSEMGPRALGNRSILANPTIKGMKKNLNTRVKHREEFRPFAPSVLKEKASEWFDISTEAPYMIINAPVIQPDKLPSVTHADGSARLQTVSAEQNPKFHRLIAEFEWLSGVPVLLNTSFNDNEAIVESPKDALETFLKTDIDSLFIGNYRVKKNNIKKTSFFRKLASLFLV